MPPRNLLAVLVSASLCVATSLFASRTSPGRRFNEVVSLIEGAHLDPAPTPRLVDAAIEAAVGRLDEHSEYLHGFRRDAIEAALDQEFVGVGLELEIDTATLEPMVVTVMPDGPARRAGVSTGSRIVAIDGRPTRDVALSDVVDRLRGPRGTSVSIEVTEAAPPPSTLDPLVARPPGTTRPFSLVRDVVRMESVLGDRRLRDGSWRWRLADAPDVALVRVVGFGEHTAAEFEDALRSLARDGENEPALRGLVLDLRDNPGGLLAAAIEVCDLLLDDGLVVTTRSRAGGAAPVGRHATAGSLLSGVPIVVLVDGLTSSAAEIVAACLQDHGRAAVAGSRTYGKGTVQSILPLAGGRGLLKLTTAEYLRPSGAPLHRGLHDGDDAPWGVHPDPGLECTPTRAALDRVRGWRRLRDSAVADDETVAPCAIDAVLAKGVERLRTRPTTN